jgi:hypothetical protein
MELDSAGGAAAFSPMQERDGRPSRGAGRLLLVHSGCLALGWPDACNHAASGGHELQALLRDSADGAAFIPISRMVRDVDCTVVTP